MSVRQPGLDATEVDDIGGGAREGIHVLVGDAGDAIRLLLDDIGNFNSQLQLIIDQNVLHVWVAKHEWLAALPSSDLGHLFFQGFNIHLHKVHSWLFRFKHLWNEGSLVVENWHRRSCGQEWIRRGLFQFLSHLILSH